MVSIRVTSTVHYMGSANMISIPGKIEYSVDGVKDSIQYPVYGSDQDKLEYLKLCRNMGMIQEPGVIP